MVKQAAIRHHCHQEDHQCRREVFRLTCQYLSSEHSLILSGKDVKIRQNYHSDQIALMKNGQKSLKNANVKSKMAQNTHFWSPCST